MKTLEDGKVILTYEEAVDRLYIADDLDDGGKLVRRTVHTFLESPIALLRADWDLEDALDLLRSASERSDESDQIQQTGPAAQSSGHGVAARDDIRGMVFFAASGPKEPGVMLDIRLSIVTPVAPGQKIRWVDRDAPAPPEERLTGTVTSLVFGWDGHAATLDAAIIHWDEGPQPMGFNPEAAPDAIQADELDQLEVVG